MDRTTEKRRHLLHCHVAGFTYWDGCIVFEQLKVGTELKLVREPHNCNDHNAVAIYFEDSKLGYIPRSQNENISIFLDMGHNDIFETRINRICGDAHTESQVHINIYIKNKNYHESN